MQVTINVAELRTLCMWAFAWSERISTPVNDFQFGVKRIADKLRDQTDVPMLIEHEVEEMKRAGIDVTMVKGGATP